MGQSSYTAQVGAQPWRNIRSRQEINKVSPALGSAKCLGLMVTHALPQPRYGHVDSLSRLTMAA